MKSACERLMKISFAPARMAPRISISNWLATAPSMRPGTVSSQLSAEVILVIGITYGVRLVDLTFGAAARQLLKMIQGRNAHEKCGGFSPCLRGSVASMIALTEF